MFKHAISTDATLTAAVPTDLVPALPICCTWRQVEAVEQIVEDAGQHNVSLDGLSICLGPDLRAMYPLVMNFGVEGELTVNGPAHPDQVGSMWVVVGRGSVTFLGLLVRVMAHMQPLLANQYLRLQD